MESSINDDDQRKVTVVESEIEEGESEDDVLILGLNEADVEGMSIDEEEDQGEEEKQSSSTDPIPRMTSPSPSPPEKMIKKKKKHRKSHKEKKVRKDKKADKADNTSKDVDVDEASGEMLPAFSSEEEEAPVETRTKRRRKFRSEPRPVVEEATKDDRIILNEGTVNSLGNYCPRMLAGTTCEESDCSWAHFMMPRDAASQFEMICQYRPACDALQFFSYFTNVDIQEDLITTAKDKLRDLGEETPDIEAKDVAREVFEEMFRNMEMLDLGLEHYMEMIEISTRIYDVKDGQGNLIQLFNKIHLLLRDSSSQEEESVKLLKWAWTHLYLASVETGLVLPTEFYNDLTAMLSGRKNITKLIEVLLYTSLLPILSPSLYSLADILQISTDSPKTLLFNHSNVVLFAQTLSRISSEDWLKLHNMMDIKPGLELLANNLVHADPASVYKFYQSLPEMEGLDIPEVTAPPGTLRQVQMLTLVRQNDWEELAERFCSIPPGEPEVLADLSETLVLRISQLEAELMKTAFQAGLKIVLERRGGETENLHRLFWTQVGLGLLLYLVSRSEWETASQLITDLTTKLSIDWLKTKPPAINIFADIDKGMVTLFVLEVLLSTRQREEIVRYIKTWDYLTCLQSEASTSRRDAIFLSVLECLTSQGSNTDLETLIRMMEVIAGSMQVESSPDKKRQEQIYNKIMTMMINNSLPGSRIYTKYRLARTCHFQLDEGVARGLVMLLAHNRNNMIKAATQVYQAGIKWGVYCAQPHRRPFTLRLCSGLTLEEMTVIFQDFLSKLSKDLHNPTDQTFTIFINLEEVKVPDYGVTVLNRVSKRKTDAMSRVETLLKTRPPLKLNRESSVPYIEGRLVKLYLGKNY